MSSGTSSSEFTFIGKEEVILHVETAEENAEKIFKDKFLNAGFAVTRAGIFYSVPSELQLEHGEDFAPKIMPIGPFQWKNEALMKRTEQVKLNCAWNFMFRVNEIQIETSFTKYISKIANLVRDGDIQSKYDPVLMDVIDRSTLIWNMLLDAFFLLELFVEMYYWREKGAKGIHELKLNQQLLRSDVLLLENQVPFSILKELFKASEFTDSNISKLDLVDIAVCYVTQSNLIQTRKIRDKIREEQFDHLLHMFHRSLSLSSNRSQEHTIHFFSHICKKIRRGSLWSLCWIIYLLSLSWLSFKRPPLRDEEKDISGVTKTFPSAVALKEAGINLKKKDRALSPLDVSFHHDDSVMEIPVFTIDEPMARIFKNLVAFELHSLQGGESYFTSYVALINNLIDTPADVALLKERGILASKLGEDEVVANFSRQHFRIAGQDFTHHHFLKLLEDANRYFESDYYVFRAILVKWREEFFKKYFKNPWTFASLMAAIILLVLTVLQTFFGSSIQKN